MKGDEWSNKIKESVQGKLTSQLILWFVLVSLTWQSVCETEVQEWFLFWQSFIMAAMKELLAFETLLVLCEDTLAFEYCASVHFEDILLWSNSTLAAHWVAF